MGLRPASSLPGAHLGEKRWKVWMKMRFCGSCHSGPGPTGCCHAPSRLSPEAWWLSVAQTLNSDPRPHPPLFQSHPCPPAWGPAGEACQPLKPMGVHAVPGLVVGTASLWGGPLSPDATHHPFTHPFVFTEHGRGAGSVLCTGGQR